MSIAVPPVSALLCLFVGYFIVMAEAFNVAYVSDLKQLVECCIGEQEMEEFLRQFFFRYNNFSSAIRDESINSLIFKNEGNIIRFQYLQYLFMQPEAKEYFDPSLIRYVTCHPKSDLTYLKVGEFFYSKCPSYFPNRFTEMVIRSELGSARIHYNYTKTHIYHSKEILDLIKIYASFEIPSTWSVRTITVLGVWSMGVIGYTLALLVMAGNPPQGG